MLGSSKSFLIVNNRGYGDVIASVTFADFLKRSGANHVSLGIHISHDISAFKYFTALDHVYNITDKTFLPTVLQFQYDKVFNQNWFTFDGGYTFYSQRFSCVDACDIIRPSYLIPDERHDYAINQLLPSLGLKPFRYITLHPQSKYKTRTLRREELQSAVGLIGFDTVVIGDNVEFEEAVNFTKGSSMEEAVLLMHYSRAFVGVCSCWSHFAWAMRKQSFIFFSNTNKSNMWGDYHGMISSVQCGDYESGIKVDDWTPFITWLNHFGLGKSKA